MQIVKTILIEMLRINLSCLFKIKPGTLAIGERDAGRYVGYSRKCLDILFKRKRGTRSVLTERVVESKSNRELLT